MIEFYKYEGAGNDFVVIDNRQNVFGDYDTERIKHYCDRHFGIGADGLILLENDETADFKMVYFNSDGRESTMCGNGGRCIVAFAFDQKIVAGGSCVFSAIDGIHHANRTETEISIQMIDVREVEVIGTDYFLDTGSPHYVQSLDDVGQLNITSAAHGIRYNDRFKAEGTNVNFVNYNEQPYQMRTYERGVEGETLACGTGVTAVALIAHQLNKVAAGDKVAVSTPGGNLSVRFDYKDAAYTNVWLTGPAKFVFKGQIL